MNRWVLAVAASLLAATTHAAALRVCATTPDLGALAAEIGGDDIVLTVFAKPAEDPHFLDAKPGFIRALHDADLYVETGLELEIGWAPALLRGARNPRILPGQPGYLDASQVITPLEVPQGEVDRSHGDVHPAGNPHYLLAPSNGLAVARLLADRMGALRPELAETFRRRYALFEQRMQHAMGSWEARLAPHRGKGLVVDHNLWIYFAEHFGLRVPVQLEPKPGVPPTARHLQEVLARMRAENLRVIATSPYADERHAQFVAKHAGAALARLAHQPGARPGSDGYMGLLNHNVNAIADAFDATARAP